MNTVQATFKLRDKMTPGLVAITTKVQGLQKGLQAIAGSSSSFTKVGSAAGGVFSKLVVGSKGISASFSRASNQAKVLNSTLGTTPGLFARLATSIKGAIGMVAGFSIVNTVMKTVTGAVSSAMQRLDTMTSFKRKMKLITGDEKNGDRALEALKESTTGTPYKLTTATMGVQNFVTRGMDTDDAVKSVNTWMDAVSAYGMGTSEELQTVLDAIGKMRTKGSVEMKQLNRLFNVGINPVQMYADAVGMAASDVSKALSNKEISADQFLTVVEKAMTEGTNGVVKITGQAKKASTTWKATIDNMNAAVSRGVANIIESFDNLMKATNDMGLKGLVSMYGKGIEKVLTGIGNIITNKITPALTTMMKALKRINELTKSSGLKKYADEWKKFTERIKIKPKIDFSELNNGKFGRKWTNIVIDFKTKIAPQAFEEFLHILEALMDIAKALIAPLAELGTEFASAFTEITGRDLPTGMHLVVEVLEKIADVLQDKLPGLVSKIAPHAKELLQTFLAYKGITGTASILSGFLDIVLGGVYTLSRFSGRLGIIAAAFGLVKLSGGDLLGTIRLLQNSFSKLMQFLDPVIDAFTILKNGIIDSVVKQFDRLKSGLSGMDFSKLFNFGDGGSGSAIDNLKTKFMDFFNQLPGFAQVGVQKFDSLLGTVVDTILDVASYLTTGEVTAESSPIVKFIDTAKRKFNEFKETAKPVIDEVIAKFQQFKEWITPILTEVGNNLKTMIGPTTELAAQIWNFIKSLGSMVLPAVLPIIGNILETIIEYLPEMSSLFSSAWNTAAGCLSTVIGWLQKFAELVIPPILDAVQKVLAWMGDHGETVSNVIGLVVSAFAGFKIFKTLTGWVSTATGLFSTFHGFFGKIVVGLIGGFSKISTAIKIFKGAKGIGGLVSAFASLANPTTWIILAIAAISALAIYLVYLYHTSDDFKQKWDAAWNMDNGIGGGLWSLVSALSVFIKFLKATWSALVATGKIVWSVVKLIWTPIEWLFKKIGDIYNNTVGKIGGWIGDKIGKAFGWDMSKKEADGKVSFLQGLGDSYESFDKKMQKMGDDVSAWIDDKNAGLKDSMLGEKYTDADKKKAATNAKKENEKKTADAKKNIELPDTMLSDATNIGDALKDQLKNSGLSDLFGNVQKTKDEATKAKDESVDDVWQQLLNSDTAKDMKNSVGLAGTNAKNNLNGIKDSISDGWDQINSNPTVIDMKNSVGVAGQNAKNNLQGLANTQPVQNAKNNIKGIVDSFAGSTEEAKQSMNTAKKNVKAFSDTVGKMLGISKGTMTGKQFVAGFGKAMNGGISQDMADKFVSTLNEKIANSKELQKGTLEGIKNGNKTTGNKSAGKVEPKKAYGNKKAEMKTLKPAGQSSSLSDVAKRAMMTNSKLAKIDWSPADKLDTAQNKLTRTMRDCYEDLEADGGKISSNVMAGLLKGLYANQYKVSKGYADFIDKLKLQFIEGFGIHSPSRFTTYISYMLTKGFEKGWTKGKLNIYYDKAITDLKSQIKKGTIDYEQWFNAFDRDAMIGIIGRLGEIDDSDMKLGNENFGITFPVLGPYSKMVPNNDGLDITVPDGARVVATDHSGVIELYKNYKNYGPGLRLGTGNVSYHKKGVTTNETTGIETIYSGLRFVHARSGEVLNGQYLGKAGYDRWEKNKQSDKVFHFEVLKHGKPYDAEEYLEGATRYKNKMANSPLVMLRNMFSQRYGAWPENYQAQTETKNQKNFSIGAHGTDEEKYNIGKSFFERALAKFGYTKTGNKAAFLAKWANSLSGMDPELTGNTYGGAPTKGLFQLTDKLFATYGNNYRGRDTNIWNPIDNTLAALKFLNDFKYLYQDYVMDARNHKVKDWFTSTQFDSFNKVVELFTRYGYNYYRDESREHNWTKNVGGIRSDWVEYDEVYTEAEDLARRYDPEVLAYRSGTNTSGDVMLTDNRTWLDKFVENMKRQGIKANAGNLESLQKLKDMGKDSKAKLEKAISSTILGNKSALNEMSGAAFETTNQNRLNKWSETTGDATGINASNVFENVKKGIKGVAKKAAIMKAADLIGKFTYSIGTSGAVPAWLRETMRGLYDYAEQAYATANAPSSVSSSLGIGFATDYFMKSNQHADVGTKVTAQMSAMGFGGTIDTLWWRMAQDYATGNLNTEKNIGNVPTPGANKPSKGYATGTTWARRGLHWVGEEGPELMSFRGGETVIPHDASVDLAQAAANRRGAQTNIGANLTQAATGANRNVNSTTNNDQTYSVGNNNTFNISKEVDADKFISQFEEQMHRVLSDGTRIMTGV